MSESECYNRIIDFFQKDTNDNEKIEIWKNRSYIKLMHKLSDERSKVLAKNAIILILNLFENFPPDIYNNMGDKLEHLDSKEKQKVLSQLKKEAF
ncbi:MAG: hypothetical protein R6W84_06175 [Promethearchaeia archaeon]